MKVLHVKKGDKVKVLSGKDKGKEGIVIKAIPKEGKVIVEGVNVFKKHKKPTKKGQKGQIAQVSKPIFASKVKKV